MAGKEELVLKGLEAAQVNLDDFLALFPENVITTVKDRVRGENEVRIARGGYVLARASKRFRTDVSNDTLAPLREQMNVQEFDKSLGDIINLAPV